MAFNPGTRVLYSRWGIIGGLVCRDEKRSMRTRLRTNLHTKCGALGGGESGKMGDGGSWEQDTYGLDRLTPIPWCIAAAAMMAAFATEELGSNKGEPPISRD